MSSSCYSAGKLAKLKKILHCTDLEQQKNTLLHVMVYFIFLFRKGNKVIRDYTFTFLCFVFQ